MKIIAADISSDRASLSLFNVLIDDTRNLLFKKEYSPQDFSAITLLLETFLQDADATSVLIERLCISIAAQVEDSQCHMQDLGWHIDRNQLAQHLSIPDVLLISDFEATARGISLINEEEILTLNEGTVDEKGICVITSAGYSLGVTWMDSEQDAFNRQATDDGHIGFAPTNTEQIALLEYMMQHVDHVSYEQILSNKGLNTLYAFCQQKAPSKDSQLSITEIMHNASTDPAAKQALHLFSTIYGTYIGNLALLYHPMGGIYLCGRIASEIKEWIQAPPFLNACLTKGSMSLMMQKTPIYLITDTDINVKGAVATTIYT